jgi:hypothetical protein
VFKPAEDFHLLIEAPDQGGRKRPKRKYFQGDVSPRRNLPGIIHDTHAACAEYACHFIAIDG